MWDLTSGAQRYQFSSPEDQPTTLAYAPATTTTPPDKGAGLQQEADNKVVEEGKGEEQGAVGQQQRHLVGGYASGTMRVFDVPSTSTLYEFQQHRGAIQQVRSGPCRVRHDPSRRRFRKRWGGGGWRRLLAYAMLPRLPPPREGYLDPGSFYLSRMYLPLVLHWEAVDAQPFRECLNAQAAR